ncbi:MAG: universal stress protein [Halobacteriaceae archaeon]
MGMYERVLVPTDGSAATDRAVAHAVELAAVHGATIHGVYVLDTASYAGLSMDTSWEGVGAMLREEGEEALAAVREAAEEGGVAVETELLEGTPAREIVAAAERTGADLVVMGTHGRGGIDRLLLGSVAERVVRTADVPVLTVRQG